MLKNEEKIIFKKSTDLEYLICSRGWRFRHCFGITHRLH